MVKLAVWISHSVGRYFILYCAAGIEMVCYCQIGSSLKLYSQLHLIRMGNKISIKFAKFCSAALHQLHYSIWYAICNLNLFSLTTHGRLQITLHPYYTPTHQHRLTWRYLQIELHCWAEQQFWWCDFISTAKMNWIGGFGTKLPLQEFVFNDRVFHGIIFP